MFKKSALSCMFNCCSICAGTKIYSRAGSRELKHKRAIGRVRIPVPESPPKVPSALLTHWILVRRMIDHQGLTSMLALPRQLQPNTPTARLRRPQKDHVPQRSKAHSLCEHSCPDALTATMSSMIWTTPLKTPLTTTKLSTTMLGSARKAAL